MEHDLEQRRQEALDRCNRTIEILEIERPAREARERARSANSAGAVLGETGPPLLHPPPEPPRRVAAAERRGRRDWQAETVWIEGLINHKIAGDLVEAIGLALAQQRRELEAKFAAELDNRIAGLRAETTALLADCFRDILVHVSGHGAEVIAAVEERVQRLDRIVEVFARQGLDAWPSAPAAPH